MRKRLFAVVLLCFPVNVALAEDPVYFADEALKTAVQDALWVFDPTPTDMLALTVLDFPHLNWYDPEIGDLTGLEYAIHLQELNLRYHYVSDLSPLADLTNLRTLILQRNFSITDISPLAKLTNLVKLDIEENDISDISVLAGLTNLRSLHLHRNDISDISPLLELTSLTFLDLRINPLSDDSYYVYIPQILANNPGIELLHDPLTCTIQIESGPGGSVTTPGEGTFVYEFGSDLTVKAQADAGYMFLNFTGSFFTAQNPVSLLLDQDSSFCANFVSRQATLYVDDDAPHDPCAADASVSDPLEDGTLEHPFDSIQEAVNVAAEGASVIVRPGTYCESIESTGRTIQILGLDPNDPNAMEYPIIDAGNDNTVVRFTGGEDPNSMLTGFVLTGGRAPLAGGILCSRSSPTITNCLIVGNRTTRSGGAAIGCSNSEAIFVNCTIADNDSGDDGAGLRLTESRITLWNSILWGNEPNGSEIMLDDDTSVLSMGYTDTAQNWGGTGTIQNDPLFVQPGYWIDADSGLPAEPDNPKAIWVLGDYHLKSRAGRWDPATETWVRDEVTSGCIDAGDPDSPIGNEPSPNGQIANMGAYGQTAQAALSDPGQ